MYRLIGSKSREQLAELFDVLGILGAGIVLPAVNVGNQQDGTAGLANSGHRFAELIAIPEVTLFVELDEAEPINILGGAVRPGIDRGLGGRFAAVVRRVRGAAGKNESGQITDPAREEIHMGVLVRHSE